MFLKLVEKIQTKSKLVKGYSKEFKVPEEYIVLVWKIAICDFLQNGKDKCEPSKNEWGIVTNIFKAILKKYLSELDETIKYKLKNPTVKGEKVHIHYEEAKEISLKEKIKEYKNQLKECCNKCSNICEE